MMGHDTEIHPELSRIADCASGLLDDEESRDVIAHLSECPECRLEHRRLMRFQGIGADVELERESDWDGAARELERTFGERVLPAVVPARRTARAGLSGFTWLAPIAAAAAVVLLIFVQIEMNGPVKSPEPDPLRGGAAFEYGITLETPVGEIARVPGRFAWRSKSEKDYYTLEIFTSSLHTVHREDRITDSSWAIPDSLRSRFEPGTIYLWNVRGYRGLEREIVSPNGWFRIAPGK
ncbi:MAG TPA: zf-HC2 domain-containing protein [Patescibacteria group bacterium]|nr:zf-HC2 domain-containing protein [Patescibacteria group bacterium]